MAVQEQDMEQYLVNLEEGFYQQGLASGLPHGHLHGLFEGRALGREKGWEIWEEVGYYQGTAMFWRALLLAQGKENLRAYANLEQVLLMVDSFPTANDSSSLDNEQPATASSSDVDIPALLTSIRSKYRAACASLGVRPRMVAASAPVEGQESIKAVGMSL
uniref:Essential protein Yae1 N-terminal domain-containing protein n=1 Tax=Leucosporidium scottii TaxID=5278 RepID=A0A0H5FSW1_9BASI|nr:hypothetical protein ls5930a1_00084 [Leucosporidium scottii]